MNLKVQQMNNAQYLAFQQQQWERLRRQQQLTPRPSMNLNVNMEKDRPMVRVKMENPSDFPLDSNAFSAVNARNPQVHQLRQQQLAAISTFRAQANNAFRPMNSLQVPQIQSPCCKMDLIFIALSKDTGIVRAQPVKVEGFQEFMGGDASMKHDSEENKLISPQK